MKGLYSLLFVVPGAFAAVPLFKRAGCNADNCVRAVTGTKINSASRVSTDCPAFQTTTVCPAASTITITQGFVATTILPPVCAAQTTLAPISLPSYAQLACSAGGNPTSRFASACACAGVTATKVTAAVPTATVVVPLPDCQGLASAGLYTHDGSAKTFSVSCNRLFDWDRPISNVLITSLKECIDACAGMDGCTGVAFSRDPRDADRPCQLASEHSATANGVFPMVDIASLI